MSTSSPIDALVTALEAAFEADPRGRGVVPLLSAYAAAEDDWRRFAHFLSDGYTRNLVVRNPRFEMLVLCWTRGQESPIHDHAAQHCWMAVLDGVVEELQYDWPEHAVPLVERRRRAFRRGEVAYIDDDIALHRVRCGGGERGISLHLYSRPIDVCRVYDERTGAVLEKTLLYHSVQGVPAAR